MEKPFEVDVTDENVYKKTKRLNVIYNNFPETTGCEKCKEVNGDNAEWCCKSQSPSMYYAEFFYIWNHARSTWSKEKKVALIVRAIKNYLSNKTSKGCIFYDNGCQTYERRPAVCRVYGVIPAESWDKRWNTLKDQLGDAFDFKPQCGLVSLKSGEALTAEQENEFYEKTKTVEQDIGVPNAVIENHDGPIGSYRTFHDHLLITLFEESVLETLTQYRLSNPSDEDIAKTAEVLESALKESMSESY